MLKLKTEVPIGTIDGVNTSFTTSEYIDLIQSITVDGQLVETLPEHSIKTFDLEIAPASSVSISFFYREELDVLGDGLTTVGTIVEDVFTEIGRGNQSKVYAQQRIIDEAYKTYARELDMIDTRERVQTYGINGLNGVTVLSEDEMTGITLDASYELDIAGMFMTEDGYFYNYFDYDGNNFDVVGAEAIDVGDKLIIAHRIPYGVQDIAGVTVNNRKLEYRDVREFDFHSCDYTTTKDYQGNKYLFLPYNTKTYDAVIQFIPDTKIVIHPSDILNIEYRYRDVITYNICYRVLASRDDDRWQWYENEYRKLQRQYRSYKSKSVRNRRNKINLAPIREYNEYNYNINIIPEGIYNQD